MTLGCKARRDAGRREIVDLADWQRRPTRWTEALACHRPRIGRANYDKWHRLCWSSSSLVV